jgi:hypothetical protein
MYYNETVESLNLMHRPKLFFYTFTTLAIFILAIAGTVALYSISLSPKDKSAPTNLAFSHVAYINDSRVSLALASTKSEQILGLSFQKNLEDDHGLLFVFKESNQDGIWMKDMNFPIDVIWFDESFRVIFIKNNFQPSSFPEIVYPTTEARYVLEVPSGFALKHQIRIGDPLKIITKTE